jgi:hypothetical protein
MSDGILFSTVGRLIGLDLGLSLGVRRDGKNRPYDYAGKSDKDTVQTHDDPCYD